MIESIKTHKGEVITGQKLKDALLVIGTESEVSAELIYKTTNYASHITEEKKLAIYEENLTRAEEIKTGRAEMTFWLWQRLNFHLTGECVSFLPSEVK